MRAKATRLRLMPAAGMTAFALAAGFYAYGTSTGTVASPSQTIIVYSRTFMLTSETPVYGAPARLLHWLTVLLLAAQYVIGWLMPDVHHDTRPVGLIALHLSVGATIV